MQSISVDAKQLRIWFMQEKKKEPNFCYTQILPCASSYVKLRHRRIPVNHQNCLKATKIFNLKRLLLREQDCHEL